MKILIDIPQNARERIIDIANSGEDASLFVIATMINAIADGTPIPDNAEVCEIDQLRKEIEARLYIGKLITHRTERDDYFDEGLKWCIELIDRHTQRRAE